MVSLSTMTPRSCTSNPLQVSTIPVMFLPMSCTSPLTVARMTLGILLSLVASVLPLSEVFIYGSSNVTISLITFADFTTCGRNILPSPKSLPTVSIPAISGPSMIATALPYSARASLMSVSRLAVRPLTRAF